MSREQETKTHSGKPERGRSKEDKKPVKSRLPAYEKYYNKIIYFGLVMARLTSALYSNISDCDEVYNYWEPTHYLQYGYGMQTWEYSPEYAIRSWFYIKLHATVANIFGYIFNNDKIKIFYAMRILFALICLFSEFSFYRTVKIRFGPHVGRNFLLFSLLSVGMWKASTAYLPSTFVMYTTMIAYSYALMPVKISSGNRIYYMIFWIGLGSLLAWPFGAAIGIIPVFEEIFLQSSPLIKKLDRLGRMVFSAISSLITILIPIIAFDYFYYKRIVVVPWNIISYNIFGDKDRGPSLYGTEPWSYYFINGFLNFNLIFIAALISLPGLVVTRLVDPYRIHSQSKKGPVVAYFFLLFRLAPVYFWLFLLTIQPHKEERFLYVIYPLICLNGSVSVFLIKGWIEQLISYFFNDNLYLFYLNRKYLLKTLTYCFLIAVGVMSFSRIYALHTNYNAPMEIYKHLYYEEIPRRIEAAHNQSTAKGDTTYNQEIFNLCLGKEWYRFPSHYFLHDRVRLRFLKSDFKGQLPKYFLESYNVDDDGIMSYDDTRDGTWKIQEGFNDRNLEEADRYVPIKNCDYIIDYNVKSSTDDQVSENEPNYAEKIDQWNTVMCSPFLDAKNSNRISRSFYFTSFITKKLKKILSYFPAKLINQNTVNDLGNLKWGEYCLLRRIAEEKFASPSKFKSDNYNNPKELGFFMEWYKYFFE